MHRLMYIVSRVFQVVHAIILRDVHMVMCQKTLNAVIIKLLDVIIAT